jgi:hypothetical protein
MDTWHWLLVGLVVIGLVPAIWLLDRLGLWLEDRGWLYYRRKQRTSSSLGVWVALQQFIEPGVKHVVEVGDVYQAEDDEVERKDRLLAHLLASLDAVPVQPDVLRHYLTLARDAGLDWQGLYQEAVRLQRTSRPERADRIPPPEEVAPQG